MKRTRKYGCDGGCLMIGNASCRVHIPNNIGDGDYSITVLSKDEPQPQYSDGWDWVGTIEGDAIHIYRYDDLPEEDMIDNIVLTLKGRYSIYLHHDRTGRFVLWEN